MFSRSFQTPASYQNMLTLSQMFELGTVNGTLRIKRRTTHWRDVATLALSSTGKSILPLNSKAGFETYAPVARCCTVSALIVNAPYQSFTTKPNIQVK